MVKPLVEFVKLKRPEKARYLCEFASEFFQKGQRVLLTVKDDNQGVTLDRFLWTWQKGAFIPHCFDNGAVDCVDDPVVICTGERNSNGSRILVMGRPCSIEFLRHFNHVIDFAETYDDALLQESRRRFAQYREAGLEPRMR